MCRIDKLIYVAYFEAMARPIKYDRRLELWLKSAQHNELKRIAKLTQTSVNSVVRAAIDKAIEPEKRSR